MGNKAPKPVLSYDDAEKGLGPGSEDFKAIQSAFAEFSRGGGPHAVIPKDAFVSLLSRVCGPSSPGMLNRIFAVLDCDGSGAIDFREFVIAMYIFRRGTKEQKLKLLFNVFDTSGSGFISKKELLVSAEGILLGGQKGVWTVRTEGAASSTVGVDSFKPLLDVMVESAFVEFDRDLDGKLSFDEWSMYAHDDPLLQGLLASLATWLPNQSAPISSK